MDIDDTTLSHLTVPEMKILLKSHGAKTTGKKSELLERYKKCKKMLKKIHYVYS